MDSGNTSNDESIGESGGEVVVVVEEGKEPKDGEDEEEDLSDFNICAFSLDVEGQEADYGKDEEDNSGWISCKKAVADNEGDEQRLHE